MKKLFSTVLLAFIAMTGAAQLMPKVTELSMKSAYFGQSKHFKGKCQRYSRLRRNTIHHQRRFGRYNFGSRQRHGGYREFRQYRLACRRLFPKNRDRPHRRFQLYTYHHTAAVERAFRLCVGQNGKTCWYRQCTGCAQRPYQSD